MRPGLTRTGFFGCLTPHDVARPAYFLNVTQTTTSGSAAPAGAIFLSYASQDAEAVKQICDALREGGLEVWFDRAELRGGDAWDQKIKRQIRECTLFLPVISAATQARPEGYFRREWKLAIERMHDMAEGLPFLVPIALDGVSEREALVPEAFLHVQWTSLKPAAVSPEFVAQVRRLLTGGTTARTSGASASAPRVRPAAAREQRFPTWARTLIALAGVSVGITFALRPLWRPAKPATVPPPASAPATAPVVEKTLPAQPKLDPSRVVLARFENLSGDHALDAVARVIEGELVRGLTGAPLVRALPLEVSGRTAAREAARKEGAALAMVGTYLREGENLVLNAEVLFVEEGVAFGTLGPVTVPVGVRGPALTEFVERLTTGASNGVITMQNPPRRLGAVTYSRPWPRWSLAQRFSALRAQTGLDIKTWSERCRELLREDPTMLKVKQELARRLRDNERYDEAQTLFDELLADRGRLSEAELQEVIYDEALLSGRPEAALVAARAQLEIRPQSNAITQVLACLWGLNRPRAAFEEMGRWWQQVRERIPEAERFTPEAGLMATEALVYLRNETPEKALPVLAAFRKFAAGRPAASCTWLEIRAYGQLGRSAELEQLVQRTAQLPGEQRMEPAMLYVVGYGYLLHAGRPAEAKHMLDLIGEQLAALPPTERKQIQNLSVEMLWRDQRGDYAETLAVLDRLDQIEPGSVHLIAYRAMVLQSMGRTDEVKALLTRLENWELRNSRGMPLYWRARIAARAGDKVRAVELLQQAVARGLWLADFQAGASDYGRFEPEFAKLRGYAPYDALLKPKD